MRAPRPSKRANAPRPCRGAARAAPRRPPPRPHLVAPPPINKQTGCERSFVAFILEPLYKLTSTVISEHPKALEATLLELGVTLRPSAYNQVRAFCVYVTLPCVRLSFGRGAARGAVRIE